MKKCIKARFQVEKCVEWNFGVVGNDPNANKAVDNMLKIEAELKSYNIDDYNLYLKIFDL